jgi:hypothetical protein
MGNQSNDLTRFNRWMDELAENAVSRDAISPEYSREFVRATNLFRRVAEYDIPLAREMWVSLAMVSYTFSSGMVKKMFTS